MVSSINFDAGQINLTDLILGFTGNDGKAESLQSVLTRALSDSSLAGVSRVSWDSGTRVLTVSYSDSRTPLSVDLSSTIPAAPARDSSESKTYNLRVDKETGAATWVEDTGGGEEAVFDTIKNILVGGSRIAVEDDDATNRITIRSNLSDAGYGQLAFNNVPSNLSSAAKTTVRQRIGAGDSDFSGAYDDLTGKPTIPPVETGASITNKLEALTGDDRLDYDALKDTPTIPTVPARAGAFTSDDEAKLDGIDEGAEKNPDRVVYFRSEDGSSANSAGLTFFIKSDNTSWQGGKASDNVVSIEINASQYGLTQDPQTDNAANQGWHSLPQDIVEHKGSSIWDFYYMAAGLNVPSAPSMRVQAETIAKNNSGNYVLQNLTFLKDFTISGSGYNWQVVGVLASPTGADAIVGVLDKDKLPGDTVYRGQLEGSEDDKFSSYNNAMVANSYKVGAFVLTSDTAGPPTSANQVRQPDIATGSGLIVLGRLRTDADPNDFELAPALTGSEYSNGDVLHITVDGKNPGHIQLTLTSALTLVGTGDSAYVWATASWAEAGDVQPEDEGDYFRISVEEPTDIPIEVSYRDVLGAPWLKVDGSNATAETKEAIQGNNETRTLQNTYAVNDTTADYYVQITNTDQQKNIRVRLPTSAEGSYDDLALQALVKPAAWFEVGGWTVDITTNYTRSKIGTSLTFAFNFEELADQPDQPVSGDFKPDVVGEDVHRGQIARPAFVSETPNIAGEGGTDNQVWTRKNGKGKWADAAGGGGIGTPSDQFSTTSAFVTRLSNLEDDDLILVLFGRGEAWSYPDSEIVRFGDISASGGTYIHHRDDNDKEMQFKRDGTNFQVKHYSSDGPNYYRVVKLT